MKRDLLKPMLVAAVALVGANLLTGCAAMNHESAQANGALSSLAFTTVTTPKDLAKWTGDRFMLGDLRSIDTYTFQVPDTGGNAGNELTLNNAPTFSGT